MFDRNKLVHAVIWPAGEKPLVTLLDAEGVVLGEVVVREPLKGSELSKMIPQGCELEIDQCTVVNMSGEVIVETALPFDTAVVTEKREETFEERLANMERRIKRREKRAERLEQEHRARMQELEDARVVEGGQGEVTPAPDPAVEPNPVEPEGGEHVES